MFHVVLYEPEIPPNTGNIIRLCANTGIQLHLIEPLGFELEDKRLLRAGLDYKEFTEVKTYPDIDKCLSTIGASRVFGLSTHGVRYYHEVEYAPGDVFVFGPETRGLPKTFIEKLGVDAVLRVPMLPTNRSLNLSNTVAIVVYEAWRQINFEDGQ